MKVFIFILFFSILIGCKEKTIPASEVPQAVKTSFQSKYPGANDVSWETEKKSGVKIYGAEFNWNGKKIEAEFDSIGNHVEKD